MRLFDYVSSNYGLAIASIALLIGAMGGPSFYHVFIHKLPSIASPDTTDEKFAVPPAFVLSADDISQLQVLCRSLPPPKPTAPLCERALKFRPQ